MHYAAYRATAFAFLILYTAVGMWGHVTRISTEDLYPFFSWSLFAQVPEREQHMFDAYVQDEHGKDAPARSIPGIVDPSVNYQLYTRLLSDFGHALENGDTRRIESTRSAYEAILRTPTAYEVRKIRFNPVQYFLTGAVISTSSVGKSSVEL